MKHYCQYIYDGESWDKTHDILTKLKIKWESSKIKEAHQANMELN